MSIIKNIGLLFFICCSTVLSAQVDSIIVKSDSSQFISTSWVEAQFEKDSLMLDSTQVVLIDSTIVDSTTIVSTEPIKKDTVQLTGLLAEAAKVVLDTSNRTKIEWLETIHDFGEVEIGDIVKYDFFFKNIGNNPAEVLEVKSSCGCTASDYSKIPVPPGEQGFVTIQFDSKEKLGKIIQSVVIYNNTADKRSILRILGTVIKRK